MSAMPLRTKQARYLPDTFRSSGLKDIMSEVTLYWALPMVSEKAPSFTSCPAQHCLSSSDASATCFSMACGHHRIHDCTRKSAIALEYDCKGGCTSCGSSDVEIHLQIHANMNGTALPRRDRPRCDSCTAAMGQRGPPWRPA